MPHGANCRYAVIAYEFQVHKRSGKCSLRFPDDVPTCSCYAQPPTPNPSYSFPACVCVFIDGRSPVVNSFSLPLAAPVISRTFSYSQPRGSLSFWKGGFHFRGSAEDAHVYPCLGSARRKPDGGCGKASAGWTPFEWIF